jgi:hypothetical protein
VPDDAKKSARGPERGSEVPEETLKRAAKVWIELEEQNKLSKSLIGRRIGLKRAPDWLDSEIFRRTLELERFRIDTERVSGLKGAKEILDQLLQLGFVEMYRRLRTEAEKIPAPVLFGDVTRLVKLRAELDATSALTGATPVSLLITVRQELLAVPEPIRAVLMKQIFDEYKRALVTVKDLLPGETPIDVVGTPVADLGADAALALPAPASVGAGGGVPRPRLWVDPVTEERA